MFRTAAILVVAASVAALLAAPPASPDAADGPPAFNPPKAYYLALGDSYAYGFQNAKFAAGLPPTAFDTGYVGVLAERLRTIRPALTTVNFGCPGESTTTFIAGPCLFRTLGFGLHDDYAGSQLDGATAFLRAHRGKVSPITVQLFGNDMGDLVRRCGGRLECVQREAPAAIASFGSRLASILGRLRDEAPDAEIVVVGGWNTRTDLLAETDPLFRAANATIATVAAQARARFADVAAVFNPAGTEERLTAICTFTLLCAEGDLHPSDAGYRVIADVVFDASGSARLS